MMRKRLWAILLLAGVASCGNCADDATTDAAADDSAAASSQMDGAGSAMPEATGGADVEMPSPDDPQAFVEAYERLLTGLVATARSIEDEEDAREQAGPFAANLRRMQAISDQFEGGNAARLGMAFARRAQELTRLGMDLSIEMQRIQSTPGLAQAFSEALDAFDGDN